MATQSLSNAIGSLFKVNPQIRGMEEFRPDLTKKGKGYLGILQRPDGGSSTELSIGVDFGQGETLIPTLVPTLSPEEVNYLLKAPVGSPTPRPILDKAVAHARQRLAQKLSPFFD